MKLRHHSRSGSRSGKAGKPVRYGGPSAAAPLSEMPDGKARCGVCMQPASVTSTGRLRQHRDRAGDECPSHVGPGIDVHLITVPSIVLRASSGQRLPATGCCHDCGRRVTGERRYCGQCLSTRRQ